MHYKNRWLYALLLSLVLIGVAFFYDVAPALNTQTRLRKTEIQLAKQLTDLKRDAHGASQAIFADKDTLTPSDRDPALLSALVAAVQTSGLHIQSIDRVSLQSEQEMVFHLTAKGNFTQLGAFVFHVETSAYPMLVMDFTCEAKEANAFLFAADVLLLKNKMQITSTENATVFAGENPFCDANTQSLSFQNAQEIMRSIPLQHMKMIGHSQHEQRYTALLLLPENVVVAVEKGFLLGKEGGVVTDIQRDHVRILLPDQSERVVGE